MPPAASESGVARRREKNRLAQQRHRSRAKEIQASRQAPEVDSTIDSGPQPEADAIDPQLMGMDALLPNEAWHMDDTYAHLHDVHMLHDSNDFAHDAHVSASVPSSTVSLTFAETDVSNSALSRRWVASQPQASMEPRHKRPRSYQRAQHQHDRPSNLELAARHGQAQETWSSDAMSGGPSSTSLRTPPENMTGFTDSQGAMNQAGRHNQSGTSRTATRATNVPKIYALPTNTHADSQSSTATSPSQTRKRPYCAKVDGAVPAGRTPLHMLCESGSEELVCRLISTGANPEAGDQYGMRPLHIAARRGNDAAVKALLDRSVSVDARDHQGWTALHHATWCGFDETVLLLVRRGASIDAGTVPLEDLSDDLDT